MCVHLWGIGFGATELWSFTILKYGCCFVLNPNLLNLHESGIYTAYALSDDIQINGDTPFEFGALELWSRLCLQNIGMLGKCSHPHLLNKKDSGDGVVPKYSSMYFSTISTFVPHIPKYGALKSTIILNYCEWGHFIHLACYAPIFSDCAFHIVPGAAEKLNIIGEKNGSGPQKCLLELFDLWCETQPLSHLECKCKSSRCGC